jgi:hypothetical protein
MTNERPACWRMPSPKQMEKLAREVARRRDIDRPDDPAPWGSLPDDRGGSSASPKGGPTLTVPMTMCESWVFWVAASPRL